MKDGSMRNLVSLRFPVTVLQDETEPLKKKEKDIKDPQGS